MWSDAWRAGAWAVAAALWLGGCGESSLVRWGGSAPAERESPLARAASPNGPTTRPVEATDRGDRDLDRAFELVVAEKYDEAQPTLARLIERFGAAGDDERTARAMLWLSFCYEKTGKKNQAEVFYRQILERYGSTAAARGAEARLEQLGLPGPEVTGDGGRR
jgi:TolA-binding protein